MVAAIVFTLGEMIALPVSGAYVAELSPETMRGRHSAAVGLTWNFAQGIAPWLGLTLYKSNPQFLWWGFLGLGFASATFILIPLGPGRIAVAVPRQNGWES